MTMYLSEDKELIQNIRLKAIPLTFTSDKFVFCGSYYGIRVVAGYLHKRYSVPIERIDDYLPNTFDIVPDYYHRHINAVYVDDKERTIRVVINSLSKGCRDQFQYLRYVTSKFMRIMEEDQFYDYSRVREMARVAMERGYTTSFELIDSKDYEDLALDIRDYLKEGQSFELITHEHLANIMEINAEIKDGKCTVTWVD